MSVPSVPRRWYTLNLARMQQSLVILFITELRIGHTPIHTWERVWGLIELKCRDWNPDIWKDSLYIETGSSFVWNIKTVRLKWFNSSTTPKCAFYLNGGFIWLMLCFASRKHMHTFGLREKCLTMRGLWPSNAKGKHATRHWVKQKQINNR